MSSWSGNRVHFRERKMIPPQVTPKVTPQIDNTKSEIETKEVNSVIPSKYFIPKNNLKSNDAVVCTIARDEEFYIDEWIKYNLALGFSHIYIYDNGTSNNLKSKNSNQVTVIYFPGENQMLTSRDIFLLQYKNKHKWVAHIDVDEFIVLKKHKSIIDFLNEYDDCDSIALNWIMFGTSNQKYFVDEPVTKRFLYCTNKPNHHFKCISKINSIAKCINSHKPLLNKGSVYDTNRKIINGFFNHDGDSNIACIHHYFTKSEEELRKKILRGQPDETPKRELSLLDDIHTKDNDDYNSDAWDFYSKYL